MNKRTKKLLAMMAAPPRLRRVSGLPPLSYTAKKAGFLADYRIYGQTVDGESVGDRTANLFDGKGASVDQGAPSVKQFQGSNIQVSPGETYYINASSALYSRLAFYTGNTRKTSSVWTTNQSSITVPDDCNNAYVEVRNYSYMGITAEQLTTATEIMLVKSSTPLPYEPYGYRVPVTVSNGTDTLTTSIYLPEQIKKVGDEAEYIDYANQKQHRVRKNLLPNTATSQTINGVTFTVNSDGSITCNGTATATAFFSWGAAGILPNNKQVFLTGCPSGGGASNYLLKMQIVGSPDALITDTGHGSIALFSQPIYPVLRIQAGYTCNNLTFYPMLRLASITDDTYEPYIENTDIDVTLPALPTLTGTNVLSVGTEVQPSLVKVTGRIRPVPTGGGE